ncbi:phospholipase [Rhodococcus sp. BP-252]|uniref:phospholipase D family protein n=1 Tax=unclassified Rhodococcus (in: high G+C Gram-positive bacteria) TaxID=192944 RepID=UPI001C9AE630|nr:MULTISPECIES: phospholipase D-like domain-containing protein [unclassified Rhodococcus (in: high G+C Gram-positive bacteria)]MBY6410913.1 phospholipase [Rhodococcus sp. BP-320]MBY6415262.1 phospholipase [Rhodococcus sp. BP-321]MBY6419877.1 phospholipase [Rhodococcus sp. BP-324]MBY6425469.1 phospholipase [Rhodococcus sp. BP-323]MBY6430468.1 phospholipase [Rhodococcus sp. BP-322]
MIPQRLTRTIDAVARRLGRSSAALHDQVQDFGSDTHPWFLGAEERGNPDTRIAAWTVGNRVTTLVHGKPYFAALADALAVAGDGDLVMFTDWRGDPEQFLTDDGVTVEDALADVAGRGGVVKGMVWRSHIETLGFTGPKNRKLALKLEEAGGEVILDQRVLALGSHHQKFVVIRYRDADRSDLAFVGGIDLARARRDDADHFGDPVSRPFPPEYGEIPAWHDIQVQIEGPAVRDVEDVFRERWEDPAALSRLPWHAIPDAIRGATREPSDLPEQLPASDPAGSCAIQLLRTYPRRRPAYPFATKGERSTARAYAKALRRARRLIYVEDQYLWSVDVAEVFAAALRRAPELRLIIVVPKHLDDDSAITIPSALLGHSAALDVIRDAGADRVLVLDLENDRGIPVYVHSKVCIVDDVWAAVGSDNFNRRSWTHDSELTAAIVDDEKDPREPTDPSGLGDGARVFARDFRLELLREHLGRDVGDDDDLVDPASCFDTVAAHADRLDAWHENPSGGPRPAGRLRRHDIDVPPVWQQRLASVAYRLFVDPDGRPIGMRFRKKF